MGNLVLDFVQPEWFQCADWRLDTKWDLRKGEGGKKWRGRVQRTGGWKLTVMEQSSNNYLSFYLTAEIHGSSSHLKALGWWVFFLSSPPPKCLYSSFFFGFHCTMLQSSYCWGGTPGSTNPFEVWQLWRDRHFIPEFQIARFWQTPLFNHCNKELTSGSRNHAWAWSSHIMCKSCMEFQTWKSYRSNSEEWK
jgi:hypothetical protein